MTQSELQSLVDQTKDSCLQGAPQHLPSWFWSSRYWSATDRLDILTSYLVLQRRVGRTHRRDFIVYHLAKSLLEVKLTQEELRELVTRNDRSRYHSLPNWPMTVMPTQLLKHGLSLEKWDKSARHKVLQGLMNSGVWVDTVGIWIYHLAKSLLEPEIKKFPAPRYFHHTCLSALGNWIDTGDKENLVRLLGYLLNKVDIEEVKELAAIMVVPHRKESIAQYLVSHQWLRAAAVTWKELHGHSY